MDERERERTKRITEKYLKKKRWASSVSFKVFFFFFVIFHHVLIRRGVELRHEGSS
jgi:hypothetical protein